MLITSRRLRRAAFWAVLTFSGPPAARIKLVPDASSIFVFFVFFDAAAHNRFRETTKFHVAELQLANLTGVKCPQNVQFGAII